MERLAGRVGVVTGGASGIGYALAERFLAEGMQVVIGDVEAPALAAAVERLGQGGREVLGVATDVSSEPSVTALRDAALERFGAVHVICNNAGVSAHGALWTMPRGEWDWVLGVNLGGVLNGIRAFVPVLLEQEEAHIVNTASIAGLIPGVLGAYSVSKHAVVALTEVLQFQLMMAGAGHVGVSVLCPGWVRTRIADAGRNRPAGLPEPEPLSATEAAGDELARGLIDRGMPPADVAAFVVDAIRTRRFYVLTHPDLIDSVQARVRAIERGEPPAFAIG
jgi:NAD(P)-dependent dehydrogenase (short-subunit alcohol dehydrogenase family)